MIMPDWQETLLDYLGSSNEDDQIIKFISEIILPELSKLEEIVWLEVGPGPGTKTKQIVQSIRKSKTTHLRQLCMVEPSLTWREFQTTHCPDLVKVGELLDLTFEDYVHGYSEVTRFHPNFITCIHVLYESELIDKFISYLKRCEHGQSSLVSCIIVESEQSDFYKLRKQLKELGIVKPVQAVREIRRVLAMNEIRAVEKEIDGQSFRLQDGEQGLDWLLQFLIGCESNKYLSLPIDIKNEGKSIIDKFIARKNSRTLDVPDTSFMISIGCL